MPVHDDVLGCIGEIAIIDGQHTGRIILYRIDTTVKSTAVDCHGRNSSSRTTVANHTGEVSFICHTDASIDRHSCTAGIYDRIVAVFARTILAIPVIFLTAHICTTIQRGRSIIYKGRLTVRDIIHSAGADNGQLRAQCHCNRVGCHVFHRLTIQVNGNIFTTCYSNIFGSIRHKYDSLPSCCGSYRSLQRGISLFANFCNYSCRCRRCCAALTFTICPAGAAQSQRHDQRQNGCQYLFHFSYPGFFRFPQDTSF